MLLPPETTLGKSAEIERKRLLPESINEFRLIGPSDWSRSFHAPRQSASVVAEWYFQCAYFGTETLHHCVEVNPQVRGGVPVLRGTRFTVSEAMAELADSRGVSEVAENFDLNEELIRELLSGLSLLLNQPYPK